MAVLKIKATTLVESLWALLLVVLLFSTASVLLERYYRIGITMEEVHRRNLAKAEWYFRYHQEENITLTEETNQRYNVRSKVEESQIKIDVLDQRKNQNHSYVFPKK